MADDKDPIFLETIFKYFPDLSETQRIQFAALYELYKEWNEKINVVSRRDIDNLYERHVLHSLAIAAFWGPLENGTRIVDVGTGGGFPGLPLAILYPEAQFHLVDRIAKKLRVAENISISIDLKNISVQHGDMAECKEKFDYAVSRAAMSLETLVRVVRKNILPTTKNKYTNGLVCLKGGDLSEEVKPLKSPVLEFPISEFFAEDFFDTKKIVYVPLATN